jgi:MOSC domain-containing protein YiiM
MASLIAACVVHQLRPEAGSVGVTAIDKRAVEGPVKVGRYGLRGDVQASRKYHGGLTQAVYVYSADDADYWARQLGRELDPGWFGENLRVEGIDPNRALVGERWRIGTGESAVELEATLPREPCMTFARWVGGADSTGWVKRFALERRLGAYFRVVKTGKVTAGDSIEVTHIPAGAPTVNSLFPSP